MWRIRESSLAADCKVCVDVLLFRAFFSAEKNDGRTASDVQQR